MTVISSEDTTKISIIEINGRIAEIESQRNAAMSRASKFAGEKAELMDLVAILQKENARLNDVVTRQSEMLQERSSGDGEDQSEQT